MERDTKQPSDTASDGTSCRLKKALSRSIPATSKELDSGVDVMQGSLTEGGDSRRLLLGVLASEATTQVTRVAICRDVHVRASV